MSYHSTVEKSGNDPERLEHVYQEALKKGDTEAFRTAIDDSHQAIPSNLLYAAWYYRLMQAAASAERHVIEWAWVVPLALINGLIFWGLSQDRFVVSIKRFHALNRDFDFMPLILLIGASVAAVFLLIYLTKVGCRSWARTGMIAAALLAAAGYVLQTYTQTGTVPFQEQYLTLMAMHLPLLAWAGIGVSILSRHRDANNLFAFLIKSLEVAIVGGLFVIAGGLFTAITIGLFEALDVRVPELVQRLFIAGGAGLIVVVATALIYNPRLSPAEQSQDQGLGKIISMLMRVMLALSLVVLVVYLAFVPFNFRAPFDNRDVLLVYTGMLFSVVALLAAVTPVAPSSISPRVAKWLRRGIIAVAALATLVGVYALAAISYRTAMDRLTPNRLAFIGWNVINIGLLCLVITHLARDKSSGWIHGMQRAYSIGSVAYVIWAAVLIVGIPWMFGIDQGIVENLPASVQEIVYEKPEPIMLKCSDSPHIYALQDGTKRWIDSIGTFAVRGYKWDDVHYVPCDDLRSVPDGMPIPSDAGSPPQP